MTNMIVSDGRFYSQLLADVTSFAEWMRPFAESFVNSPAFQKFGLIFLFFYAQSPSIVFLPNEIFTAPLFLGGAEPIALILVLGIGGFLGDVWLYLLGKYSSNYFRKAVHGHEKDIAHVDHIMHKHRYIIFMTPAIPYVPTFVGDGLMLLAGHQNLEPRQIMPILFLAEMIKAVVIVLTVMGIIELVPMA